MESEGTAVAVDTTEAEVNETIETGTTDTTVANSFFSTPAPEMPLPKSHKHRGTVTSVRTLLSAAKQTPGIEINLRSESNGKDYSKTIWVIPQYQANPNLDGETLRNLPAAEGKSQTPFERYGRTIQNSKGTGELQQLVNAALQVGRTFTPYTTFDQLGESLNQATSGVPVIFTDKPEETETGFTVKVNSIYGINHVDAKGRGIWDVLKAEAADGN